MTRYGPETAAVERLLARAAALTQRERSDLHDNYPLTRGEGQLKLLSMSRDFSWHRLHQGLDRRDGEPDLHPELNRLWKHMRPQQSTFPLGMAVKDAACATMVGHRVGHGPFRPVDYDLLLAPWRTAVDGDPRSRIA